MAECLPDSRGIHATMYVNDRYNEQRKVAKIRSKYDKIIIMFETF